MLLAAACALPAASADAQALVLGATGQTAQQYKVGTTIKYGTMIRAGDRITILDANGTRYIIGPKAVTATADSRLSASVASALVNEGGRHERLGAVRAMNAPPRVPAIGGKQPPSLWSVDIRYGGTRCFLPGMKPELWRASEADTKELKLTEDGHAVPVKWPAGAESVTIPAEQGGGSYRAETPGRTIMFKVKFLDDMPTTAAALKDKLEAAGCREQAGTLADNVNLPGN